METDRNWVRIREDLQALSVFFKTALPPDLLAASGTIWQRERKQREALKSFLATLGLPTLPEPISWDGLANLLDELVLTLPSRNPPNDAAFTR